MTNDIAAHSGDSALVSVQVSIERNGYPARKARVIGIQRLLRKARNEGSLNDGFTLVEVIIVTTISLIILVGLVVLLTGTIDISKSNRSLLAITDSSRRALSTMSRELGGALLLVNSGSDICDIHNLTFHADVRGDTPGADVTSSSDQLLAPKVQWTWDQTAHTIKQTITPPGTAVTLASDVVGLEFRYYGTGSEELRSDADYNAMATRIVIIITVQKGGSSRKLSQDVFLRVMDRVPSQ